jgi:hypothetical protein
MCLISQISSIPSHKVAINSGFGISYGLPFRLKDFYSPIFWARSFSNVTSPMLDFFDRLAFAEEKSDDVAEVDIENDLDLDETTTAFIDIEDDTTTTERPKRKRKPKMKRDIARSDLTAGQFYASVREMIG